MGREQKKMNESRTEDSPRIDYNHGSQSGSALLVEIDPPPAVTDSVGNLKNDKDVSARTQA